MALDNAMSEVEAGSSPYDGGLPHEIDHKHADVSGGWLRAATFGAMDGLVSNTALIDGVRRFAMDVRELDVDLIDRINPFGEAYAILSKAMNEDNLKQVAAAISAKKTKLTPEEAKELAIRAVKFKKERGRIPSIDSQDAWERRMAEGAAAFVRYKDEGRYERN